MLRNHLFRHGQTYGRHFSNNWRFTRLALKSAAYTFGHGVTPRISGKRASELHNELWDQGRVLSIDDITHRLNSGLYSDVEQARADFEEHARLYNEQPRFEPFRATVEQHFAIIDTGTVANERR